MNMKIDRSLIVIAMSAVAIFFCSSADAHPRENQYVNGVNRLPARATSYSYANEADALTYDRRNSRMTSLNGVWKFHFAEDIKVHKEEVNKSHIEFYDKKNNIICNLDSS